jgi:DNA-directed RNA polymerase specialized sigma24 family protein
VALRQNATIQRQLSTLFNCGTIGELTDGQLLERFLNGQGESAELAFAALVERHGPIVLHTCRSIVRDEHEAEDAFQATFLVLVRKAGALWTRDSLGPWLYQVAYRYE